MTIPAEPSTNAIIESAPTDPIGTASGSVAQRIAVSIDMWKRKLLDLTKRNRALNFRVNKVSTVAIVDEQPAEVFRRLVIEGGAMRFRATAVETAEAAEPAGDGGEAGNGGPTEPSADEAEDESASFDFVPYEAANLADHHTDDVLQTSATPDQLDKSLRRLDEQAHSSLEEQGVNTLFLALGMLHYKESPQAETILRAPLVLIPVALERRGAKAGYTLSATDDPIVNPALNEYLRRFHGGLTLPELPDPSAIPDDYDFQSFLRDVADRIAPLAGWSVKRDIFLALFAFQKLVMYKDLDANSPAIAKHELVRKLIAREGGYVGGLPDEVADMDLDAEYPPEHTAQVVDADSSQLRAIATVAKGHHLVLEGPPGTGKSQTITNLIARALADGKSVLFVAEKMAALQVVATRLAEAGLGEFCLELHSTKANKRAVMQQIAAALEASLQRTQAPQRAASRLPAIRGGLTAYAQAVHTPFGALGRSPFYVYGDLDEVLDAPKIKWTGPVETLTEAELTEAVRSLEELATAAAFIGSPAEHPWRDSTKTYYSEADLDAIGDVLAALRAKLAGIATGAEAVRRDYDVPPIQRLEDVRVATRIAEVMARSPGAPLGVISSDAWNAPPASATELIAEGRALDQLRERVAQRFSDEVLDLEHADDIGYVEQKSQGLFSFLAFLDGRYRSIKRRWLGYRKPGFQGSLVDQAAEMRHADRLRQHRAAFRAKDSVARDLFGALWQGEGTDWAVLEAYVRWVIEFRAVCVQHGLAGRALETAAQRAPDVAPITRLAAQAEEVQALLGDVRTRLGWPPSYLSDAPLDELRHRADALIRSMAHAPRWAAFEAIRARVAAGPTQEALAAGMAGQVPFPDLGRAFRRAFYQQWLSAAVKEREPLRAFATMTHEQRIKEFRELDEHVLAENQAGLIAQLRQRVQERLRAPEVAQVMPHLRREMARQRNLSPIRTTMRKAEAAIRAIKPCFMMSPLTVAQFLDGSEPTFDLIVFDEASQLPAEDAMGAIIRGRQLVVVGDPKQLPPTNFFAVQGGHVTVQLDEDGTPIVEDTESILEEFMGAGVPQCRLKWHYRSAHESLITFSNVSFYDADLYTFPSVHTGTDGIGLQFEYVQDGVYEGKGLNQVEARRVADAVVVFAKEQAERTARGEAALTLGVGTFNLRQQLAIQDELEQRRRADPSIEPFFARREEGGFFVKNLENIQGDERDVIFLSVTYAKDREGRLRYNFGPLNGENGWRRLNVLTTRARRMMRVFSSMRGDEINAAATTSLGARLLRDFLLYAERGRLESVIASASARTESPFEREVYQELTRRGVKLQPQVGMAGYRIDFGVLDDVTPGRYLCGLECDGVAYHASETARDRDRLRQQVLEARGWAIHRIWSTDWFKDRSGTIERILGLIEVARRNAKEEAEEAKRAAERAAAECKADAEEEALRAAARQAEAQAALAVAPKEPYVRREGAAYTFASTDERHVTTALLDTPTPTLIEAVVQVVRTEGPVHLADVGARIAAMWDTRLGSRIHERIEDACRRAAKAGVVTRRGEFFYHRDTTVIVRSRAGTRIPADRVAPEEYRAAVLAILEGGHSFDAEALATEVRVLLGYGRMTPALEEGVGTAVATLLTEQRIGEGPLGLRLRS